MKIVIAPDSFKGSLDALEAATSINRGVKRAFTDAETVLLPVADGGEGTLDTLVHSTGGEKRSAIVIGPLGDEVEAEYGVLGDGETCVIEMAASSGLTLIPEGQLAPLQATTYGMGQLIKQGLDDGFSSFILALGGSATNDGGAGMLQALGLNILDKDGNEIGFGGGELNKVHKIELSSFDLRIKDSTFVIASDVQNPLIGENGASHVFGPQKGATPEIVEVLDDQMAHWADKVEEAMGIRLHNLAGAGAAGGIGGAFIAFFPSVMKRGIDIVTEQIGLDEAVSGADLVITGEGQVDYQTASGKTPMGVAQVAKNRNVPTVILAGSVGEGIDALYQFGVISIHSIINRPMTLSEAIEHASELIEVSAEQVVRSYFHQLVNKNRGGSLV